MKNDKTSTLIGRPVKVIILLLSFPSIGFAAQEQILSIPITVGGSETIGVVMAPELQSLHEKNKDSLLRNGYVERLDQELRAQYVQARMAERKGAAKLKGLENDPKELGYFNLTQRQFADYSKLSFYPTILPSKYLRSESNSYLIIGGQALKQLHTHTPFGTILIDEVEGAATTFFTSNVAIAGNPATITYIKYKDDVWATAIYATQGNRLFIIESDLRLELDVKQDFIKMVEELLISAIH